MRYSSPNLAMAYWMSAPTAAATFETSVQGVVVQTKRPTGSPFRVSGAASLAAAAGAGPLPATPFSRGKRTNIDGSVTNWYPDATSCDDRAVPQRGQYGTTLYPS